MAVIQMPARKSENETGMITKWHKKTGDWVEEGDELFSFDTDEGTFTVKSQKAGRLVAVFVPEGEIVHCPADVGMLTTPSPDSVLKIGRQQFIDQTKPAEAREPAPAQPEETEEAEEELPEEVSSEDAEEVFEEEPEETAVELTEEELLEAEEESEEFDEAADEETEAPVSEEELLQYVEEDTDDLEALEPDLDEAETEEEEATEEEPVEEEPVEEEADEETVEPAEEEAVAAAKPASVTAQADMTLCMDIAARTGVSLGAMVRFAAMHTELAEYMDAVEAQGLRALNELTELANVRDLSSTGITMVNAGCASGVELLVPAMHDAWRVSNDALEVYPCLNLTLAFDENVLKLEKAAALLKETCEKLENLIDLLI